MPFLPRVRRISVVLTALLVFLFVSFIPAGPAPEAGYKFMAGKSIVQAKNYYLLTLLEEIPDLKRTISSDAVLSQLAKNKLDSISFSLKNCAKDAPCYVRQMKFSAVEIAAVGQRLRALYQPGNALGKMVTQHLIPSGAYVLFQSLAPVDMLVKAWEQDAAGVNFAIGVYAAGEKPNYPLIDSISFQIKDSRNTAVYNNGYLGLLYNTASFVATEQQGKALFFTPSLSFALRFLEMNEREQAADFEPMTEGENKAAFQKAASTKWADYPYSVILIPGAGPDDPAVPLSAEGMLRCRLAVLQYQQGKAPFLMPSGGKVHPYKTKYCEATEMKRYMVEKLGVPESAVLIEPHARHTTTNMRNAVRLMFRYGFPFSKPGLTCTTRGQSAWIGTTLTERCMRELKLIPYKPGKRWSETEIEFYPLIEALHINPSEPIDP